MMSLLENHTGSAGRNRDSWTLLEKPSNNHYQVLSYALLSCCFETTERDERIDSWLPDGIGFVAILIGFQTSARVEMHRGAGALGSDFRISITTQGRNVQNKIWFN
jgi:hypothetical protein